MTTASSETTTRFGCGDIRFETARVTGKGPYKRWAARAFVIDPKCILELPIARYAEDQPLNGDYMGLWDTYAYGCTDTHAIERFKVKYAPEIRKAQDRARSYNWPKANA